VFYESEHSGRGAAARPKISDYGTRPKSVIRRQLSRNAPDVAVDVTDDLGFKRAFVDV